MKNLFRTAEGKAGRLAAHIGEGLLAGVIGTAAITLSRTIDMKISKEKESSTPADAASKTLGVQPNSEEEKKKFSTIVHWLYGTAWGAAKGVLNFAGIKGWKGTLLQFAAVWGAEMVMLPSLKVAPAVKGWSAKQLVKDGFHHIVYTIIAGLVFDELHKQSKLALANS